MTMGVEIAPKFTNKKVITLMTMGIQVAPTNK